MEIFIVLLFFLHFLLSKPYNASDPNYIIFGQSCARSGPSGDLGTHYSSGIQQAFEEANSQGGIFGGKKLILETLDDKYDPHLCAINTNKFLGNSSIFSLLGYVGTPTSKNVSGDVLSSNMTFIAPLTGAKFLRNPFVKNFVNLRASYEDEASAMIHWAIRKKYRMKFSILYQDDSFGKACYDAVNDALVDYGLTIESSGTYQRNDPNHNTTKAYFDIGKGQPDVIFLAGVYGPLSDFVKKVQEDVYNQYPVARDEILFIAFSFVGTSSFAEYLVQRSVTLKNIYVSEVVPNIQSTTVGYDDKYPVLKAFKAGRNNSNLTFKAFEGYVAGKVTISMIQHLYGNKIDRELFLDIVYSERKFDVGGIVVGKFWKTGTGCNQGLHQVFPVSIEYSDSKIVYQEISGADDIFSWDGCSSEDRYNEPMLYFKQSAPLTGVSGKLGLLFERGLRAALYEFNKEISITDRAIGLTTKDDQYVPSITLQNTNAFLGDPSTFGLLGYVGTPTFAEIEPVIAAKPNVPFVGAFTGSSLLRKSSLSQIINIRTGYDEEIGSLVQWIINKKISKFGVLYQNDEFGSGCKDTLVTYLKKMDDSYVPLAASFERNSMNVETAISSLLGHGTSQDLEAVFLFGTYSPLAKIIKLMVCDHGRPDLYFLTVSFVGTNSFLDEFQMLYKTDLDAKNYDLGKILVSEVVPNYDDKSLLIVNNYQTAMNELGFIIDGSLGFVSFEGYISGRLVIEVMKKFSTDEMKIVTGKQFLDKLYDTSTLLVDNLQLGPYSKNSQSFCNTGLRSIWMASLKNYDITMENSDLPISTFSTCRIDENTLKGSLFVGQSYNSTVTKYSDFSKALDLSLKENMESKDFSSCNKNVFVLQKTSSSVSSDLSYFKNKDAKGLVGISDSSCVTCVTTSLPFIAPMKSLFGPHLDDLKKAYYVRPFVFDEVYYLNEYIKTIPKKVHALYQDDTSGAKLKVYEHLYSIGITCHKYTDSGSVQTIADRINSDESSKNDIVIIYLLDDISILVNDIYPKLTKKPKFAFPSNYDEGNFKSALTGGYYTSSVFLKGSSSYTSFQSSNIYSQLGKNKDFGYYGYVVGKLLFDNQLSAQNNGKGFVSNILTKSIFSIEESVTLKYDDTCNVGIRKIHIYDNDQILKKTQEFQTEYCTLYGNIHIINPDKKKDDDDPKGESSPVGAIIGGVVGGFFSIVIGLCVFCCSISSFLLVFLGVFVLIFCIAILSIGGGIIILCCLLKITSSSEKKFGRITEGIGDFTEGLREEAFEAFDMDGENTIQ